MRAIQWLSETHESCNMKSIKGRAEREWPQEVLGFVLLSSGLMRPRDKDLQLLDPVILELSEARSEGSMCNSGRRSPSVGDRDLPWALLV